MIHKTEIPFSSVKELSKRDIHYRQEPQRFKEFISFLPELDSFPKAINAKKAQAVDRKLLVDSLLKQYEEVPESAPVIKNILSLGEEQGFCVCTAHQPSLMTGPLYYVYKIISTIRLSAELNKNFPDYQFVPVFVNGGEDHDFEEVNHLNLFGKKLQWNTDQTGPVGRFSLNGLNELIDELKEILGSAKNARELASIIEQALAPGTNYGEFVFRLVHALFADFGLVILNMDQKQLKEKAVDIFREELLHSSSQDLVEASQQALENIGYKSKAYAREINLFYLGNQYRERIVFDGNTYKVLNTELQFSQSEILTELSKHPERFSPNVILRPLYQELILPNLAYVGGGGEIAYWLERKSQFEHYGIAMPILIRRNSVLWLDRRSVESFLSMGFSIEDIFKDEDLLVNQYISSIAESEFSLAKESREIDQILADIAQKAVDIDPTLAKSFKADSVKILKNIEQMESRLKRAEKQKHEVSVKRIQKIKQKFFPEHSLQERSDNFIPFYLKFGKAYFEILYSHLNPLNPKFLVVSEV